MGGDKDKIKKGFSGLTGLASEISDIEDSTRQEADDEIKTSSVKQATTSQREAQPNEPEQKATTHPPFIEINRTGKTDYTSGWKWAIGIFGVIVVIWIFNNGGQGTSNQGPTTTTSTNNTYESQPDRSNLAGEIENGKARALQMEEQIKDMDSRLEDYERRMRVYKSSDMVDEYNLLVPSYNSLVASRNELFGEYNDLVSEVNSKVTQYNSGYR